MLRPEFFQRMRRRMMLIATIAFAAPFALVPSAASGEGLFDFLFGGLNKQQQRQAPPQDDPWATGPGAGDEPPF